MLPGLPAMEAGFGIDPPDPPDVCEILTAPNRYQADLLLEPVGLEVDGQIKKIESLSYKPPPAKGGWKYIDADQMTGVAEKFRPLALQSVFRWYRPKLPITLPGVGEPVNNLDLILPLDSKQIERCKIDGRDEPRPPWVYGKFWEGTEAREPSVDAVTKDLRNKPRNLYHGSFSIDVDTALVKFGDPVFDLREAPGIVAGYEVFPAQIYLRIACGLRHEDTRAWRRSKLVKPFPG
jgi:hypothetical protein